jgi:hypothetical protein
MNTAPNYAAVLRDINAERADEAARIAERLRQWSADVERAVAVCTPDAGPATLAAAQDIDRLQVFDADGVVLLGAVFRAIYRDDVNRYMAARQDALACLSDAIEGMVGEVRRYS